MKTIKKAKLALNRESLVELDSNFLNNARGGFDGPGDDGGGGGADPMSRSFVSCNCNSVLSYCPNAGK
jgi:hypothetical protein